MRRLSALSTAILLAMVTAGVSSQGPSLSIVSASPRGDLTELADAGEVRLVFSEPMIALGDAAAGAAPAWMTITPSVRGNYHYLVRNQRTFAP